MGAAVSVVDFDARRLAGPLRHQQQRGLAEPALSQPRRRHVRGRRGAARHRRSQPRRDRRLDGRGLGRLRQRRLRGPASLSLGPARAVPQRRRARASRASPRRRACRRGPTSTPPSGSTTTATAGSTSSSAATTPRRVNLWKLADTKMMPESFEYANNGGRKYLFHNLGGGRFEEVSAKVGHRRRGAGRWQPSPPTCAAPAIPTSSSPTTTASRSCSSTRAGTSARWAARPASATRRRAA